MSKSYYMRQCLLRSTDENKQETCWIPESKAVQGKNVVILEREWKVELVGKLRILNTTIMERSRDYLHTREASDI